MSSDDLLLSRTFDAPPGEIAEVAPGVRRIVAPNPGPFTFTGTNTFLIGRGEVALVDPGPLDESHRAAIERALAGDRLAAVIVTHTHRDHSPLAAPLAATHGAPVYGFGPHRPARVLREGETGPLDSAGDTEFAPDILLADGDRTAFGDHALIAVHTPGHTANHLCLALEGTGLLLSGDHVMAWSTTVVAPPDGRMADYMASLEKLLTRDDRRYLPAHGGPVEAPGRFVRGLIAHRRQREAAILKRLSAGDRTIDEIVAAIYAGLDPRLRTAAGLSVLAHLENLIDKGAVTAEGEADLAGVYVPVR